MRSLLPLALLGFGIVVQVHPAAAQSAYDYPWCALRGDRSGRASLRGIGGSCIRNPYQTRGPRERGPYRY